MARQNEALAILTNTYNRLITDRDGTIKRIDEKRAEIQCMEELAKEYDERIYELWEAIQKLGEDS